MHISYSKSILNLFVVTSYFCMSNAFQITKISTGPNQPIQVGETVRLACQSDAAYEYCVWRHKNRVCQFEWKRAHDEVKKQTCAELNDRAHFRGSYDDHECSIDLGNVQLSDQGEWSCEMEHYVWGPARGSTHKMSMNLKVIPKRTDISVTFQSTVSPKSSTKESAFSEGSGVDEQSTSRGEKSIKASKSTTATVYASTSRSGEINYSQNISSTTTSLSVDITEDNVNTNNETIEKRNLPFKQTDDVFDGDGTNNKSINKPDVTAIILYPIILFLNLSAFVG